MKKHTTQIKDTQKKLVEIVAKAKNKIKFPHLDRNFLKNNEEYEKFLNKIFEYTPLTIFNINSLWEKDNVIYYLYKKKYVNDLLYLYYKIINSNNIYEYEICLDVTKYKIDSSLINVIEIISNNIDMTLVYLSINLSDILIFLNLFFNSYIKQNNIKIKNFNIIAMPNNDNTISVVLNDITNSKIIKEILIWKNGLDLYNQDIKIYSIISSIILFFDNIKNFNNIKK